MTPLYSERRLCLIKYEIVRSRVFVWSLSNTKNKNQTPANPSSLRLRRHRDHLFLINYLISSSLISVSSPGVKILYVAA
ncbi:hypothetical protein AKJ16_DCAP16184 [Drosera capensis]